MGRAWTHLGAWQVLFAAAIAWQAVFAPSLAAVAEESALAGQIDKLNKALGDAPKEAAKDTAVKALNELLKTIGKLDCDSGTAKVNCKINEFKSFTVESKNTLNATAKTSEDQLKDLWDYAASVLAVQDEDKKKDTRLNHALDLATKVATGTESVNEPAAVFKRLHDLVFRLATLIVQAQPRKTLAPATIETMLKDVDEASTKLDGIASALGRADNVIRVTGAWFGDLRAIRLALAENDIGQWDHTQRFCSATRAVRALCEGKQQCFQPSGGSGNTTAITGASLCGYEPAPFAEPEHRGLIVRYDCLSAHAEAWTSIAGDNDKLKSTIEQGYNDAQLRNAAVAVIRCEGPPNAATQAADVPNK